MELTRTENVASPMACTFDQDLALVHACKNGDGAAFEQLVKREDCKLFRIAQHITHNREDAQDAVQEGFLKVFRQLSQFRETSKFSTWLTRITINESLMKLRKQHPSREPSIDEDCQSQDHMAMLEVADWAPNPEHLYRGFELQNILRNELQGLQPGLRLVFVLRDVEGMSIEQTAEVLELTHVAVKARLWRARLQLRERLSKYFEVEMADPRIEHGPRGAALEKVGGPGSQAELSGTYLGGEGEQADRSSQDASVGT